MAESGVVLCAGVALVVVVAVLAVVLGAARNALDQDPVVKENHGTQWFWAFAILFAAVIILLMKGASQ